MALFDAGGRLVGCSGPLAEIAGAPREELVGRAGEAVLGPLLGAGAGALAEGRREPSGRTAEIAGRRYRVWTQRLIADEAGAPLVAVVLEAEEDARLVPARSLVRRTPRPQPSYGDLTELNTDRTILDAVGKDVLARIAQDYLDLLDTSSAIYERNGDYALGIFSSGWCRTMDAASRARCGTEDDREALRSGMWHCHESCWNEATRPAIESGKPQDIECRGGIRLYAIPIKAGGEIIGGINFGYGDPPTDPERLRELSERYGVDVAELRRAVAVYQSCPPFMVELAKRWLGTTAEIIGEIVSRKRAEAERERLIAALDRSNKDLDQFAYVASHDLKAPLRGIANLAQWLAEDLACVMSEESREQMMLLQDRVHRLEALIDGILQYSRAGRVSHAVEVVDVGKLLAEVKELLAPPGGAVIEIGAGLPVLQTERVPLQQVFLNLVGNALKHAKKQDPHVRVEARDAGKRWEFSVIDDGPGIPPEYHERIFGIFQKLEARDRVEGAGVGLSVVRKLVEANGGRAWVESEPGRGAAFRFTWSKGEEARQGA